MGYISALTYYYYWGGFLTRTHKGMINAFLRRMYKYHFVSECFDIDSIVDDMHG